MSENLTSSEAVLNRCFELQLLYNSINCEKCEVLMRIRPFECIDSFQWECPVYKCRKRYSIRKDSIFENSKLQLG